MGLTELLREAIAAALKAGNAILGIYNKASFSVELKADESPLTMADRQAHQIIKNSLAKLDIPIISEEGRAVSYSERQNWERCWIVDPLDGTKEFIKRNGEFTVNIAMIEKNRPVLGVVFAPVPRTLYYATLDNGAYKVKPIPDFAESEMDEVLESIFASPEKLPCPDRISDAFTIVGSRSHASDELLAYVEQKRTEKGAVQFIQAGSSLKICLVAEGTADVYPRLGPTMEWDTAAGHVVAESAGAKVKAYQSGKRLNYNKPDFLNPWFIVER